jgi:hypothetical protein
MQDRFSHFILHNKLSFINFSFLLIILAVLGATNFDQLVISYQARFMQLLTLISQSDFV